MKRPTMLFIAFVVAIPLASFLPFSEATTQATTGAVVQPQAKLTTPLKGITTPKEHLGFNLGDDYCLANYTQLQSYWAKLAKQSDRLKIVEIGKTEEGRPQLMGIVTSPANHAKLEHYRHIAKRMADAEGVSKEEAAKLAEEGKAVIWIDGGLHASEVLCAQMLMETMYQYLVANDAESLRILDDVIILFVHANPDGMELCANTYMNSSKNPQQRREVSLGRLYQKYVGHDNNRDSFGNTQSETKNMNRIMFREWLPQIVFNHHQTGPTGTILFCPPFRDPANYNVDPLVTNGIDKVGAAIQERFLVENKPGATTRSGAPYSGWWNGGVRTTATFHNMIGLLTETVGSPTPINIPLVPDKLLSKGDYLAPVPPQVWHFRQSVDYSVSSNKAVLDFASRNRRHLLYNIWRMGMNSIERGSRDTWTITPKLVAEAKQQTGSIIRGSSAPAAFEKNFHKPDKRDPRGFIVPASQPDFLTATKFINALLGTGVRVHVAKADFKVAGKNYPKGSYIIKSAQAFRPHVMDMFEPQDHPNDIPYPGAAPQKPYDAAGWTMAFTMAVKFDRILEGFDGPFEEIKDISVPPPPGSVAKADGAVGFFLDTRANDAFRAVNQLHAAGHEVKRLQAKVVIQGASQPAGTFFIPRTDKTVPLLEKIAREVGTSFTGTTVAPGKEAVVVKQARVALWDTGNGSIPSGWTRWILEKMEFPFKVVKSGAALDKFDVLILPDGGSWDTAAAKTFIENGGAVLAVGSSTSMGTNLGLPMPKQVNQTSDKYYIPMSVLRVKMDLANPLAWGMEEYTYVMFNNSPTFKITPSAADKNGMKNLAWFDTTTPLRSGWALGQEYLEGGVTMIDVKMGKGRLALFGPQITFRAQPHGTFKLLFNGIVQAGVKSGT